MTAGADSTASISNLWVHGGFFPTVLKAYSDMLAFMMFAFGGIELISMAAAETENPDQNIPKAVNQTVIARVLILYPFLGGTAVAGAVEPVETWRFGS